MNYIDKLGSVGRIRRLAQSRPEPTDSEALNDNIQQGFNDSMVPRPAPMLPPDSALNTPVEYHPITKSGYVQRSRRD